MFFSVIFSLGADQPVVLVGAALGGLRQFAVLLLGHEPAYVLEDRAYRVVVVPLRQHRHVLGVYLRTCSTHIKHIVLWHTKLQFNVRYP